MDSVIWLGSGFIAGFIAMALKYRTVPLSPESWIVALVLGLGGGWIGGWLADRSGLEAVNWVGSIIVAFVGAWLLLGLLLRALPRDPGRQEPTR